MTFRVKWESR